MARTMVQLVCRECGISFERPKNHASQPGQGQFCSARCKNKKMDGWFIRIGTSSKVRIRIGVAAWTRENDPDPTNSNTRKRYALTALYRMRLRLES